MTVSGNVELTLVLNIMMLMRALPLFVSLALGEAFDYVIIGGGTSGLVLANRLSENPNVTVAVIEAGTDVRDYPGVMRIDDRNLVLINESIDWQYTSPPQKNLGNRTLLYHAGKALGGSSTINGMARAKLAVSKRSYSK